MGHDIKHKAQALLELRAREIERHAADAKAWGRARELAGPAAGDWAYADNTAKTKAMEAVHRWHRERKTPTLVISGPNGRGKSIAAVRWLGRTGGVFMRADDLGREGWDGGDIARDAMHASHLVIDDMGSERGRARDHVTAILCARHDRGAPTLVTTVLLFGEGPEDPVTFASWYPESVASRITLGFRHVTGDELRCEKNAEPDLTGIRASHAIALEARRCRWAADGRAAEPEASTALEALCGLLGVTAAEVEAKAAEVAQRHLDGVAYLEAVQAELQRKAVEIADARCLRLRNAAAGGEVG